MSTRGSHRPKHLYKKKKGLLFAIVCRTAVPRWMLSFTVCHASSCESSHPGSELESYSADSTGWQSARHASYPQELVLRFHGTATIRRLQLLSHQFKIARRVELFVGRAGGGGGALVWSRLGHFSLDANEQSRFEVSREREKGEREDKMNKKRDSSERRRLMS